MSRPRFLKIQSESSRRRTTRVAVPSFQFSLQLSLGHSSQRIFCRIWSAYGRLNYFKLLICIHVLSSMIFCQQFSKTSLTIVITASRLYQHLQGRAVPSAVRIQAVIIHLAQFPVEEPASNILWREIMTLDVIVRCMPSDLWTLSENDGNEGAKYVCVYI